MERYQEIQAFVSETHWTIKLKIRVPNTFGEGGDGTSGVGPDTQGNFQDSNTQRGPQAHFHDSNIQRGPQEQETAPGIASTLSSNVESLAGAGFGSAFSLNAYAAVGANHGPDLDNNLGSN